MISIVSFVLSINELTLVAIVLLIVNYLRLTCSLELPARLYSVVSLKPHKNLITIREYARMAQPRVTIRSLMKKMGKV